jgi:hypothetical protein
LLIGFVRQLHLLIDFLDLKETLKGGVDQGLSLDSRVDFGSEDLDLFADQLEVRESVEVLSAQAVQLVLDCFARVFAVFDRKSHLLPQNDF